MKKIEQTVSEHYSQKVLKYGSNSIGMDWSSRKNQYLRFVELIRYFNFNNSSIHDLGCGNGEMLSYLKKKKIKYKKYFGSDISDIMIKLCNKKYSNSKKIKFYNIKNKRIKERLPKCDYVVASGIFNIKNNIPKKNWEKYFYETIKYMFKKSKKGISFNVLTFDTTFRNPKNFYPSTERLMKFLIQKISKKILINHTYGLWEYTIFIYK